MYVIQRTDKDYGNFTIAHETLDQAKEEAERLCTCHVKDNPTFIISELKEIMTISSTIGFAYTYPEALENG